MIIANGREAVNEMLRAFSRQRGYRLAWDFDPAQRKTEYRFRKDIGHTELVKHIYVFWFEADNIWTVLNTIIEEVDMNFYRQEREEFLKAGECAAQGVTDGMKYPNPELTEKARNIARYAINSCYGILPDSDYSNELWPKENPHLNDEFVSYCKADVEATKKLYEMGRWHLTACNGPFKIKKVIFNEPATIVLWADGTKTVVKATDEEYDPEKGLAMAISKKALGNKREYYHTFLHWLKKYDKQNSDDIVLNIDGSEILEAAAKSIQRLAKTARDVTGTLI